MNYSKNKIILTAMLGLLLSAPAFCEQAIQPTSIQKQLLTEEQPKINRTISSKLYDRRPDELIGKKVHNSNEELVGKIEAVVSSRQDGQVHAVIAKGGFMGMGATTYAVPLFALSINQDKLYLRSASGKNLLDKTYNKQGYVSIEPVNQPISEFSAFEERLQ